MICICIMNLTHMVECHLDMFAWISFRPTSTTIRNAWNCTKSIDLQQTSRNPFKKFMRLHQRGQNWINSNW
jgi:hypothetical protein